MGAMLRAYHEAVADLVPPAPAIWCHGRQVLAPGEIVLHGDFGPHNLIWTGDRLSGVIDFELARPGLPEEDAIFAALRVAHLRPDEMARAVGFDRIPDRRARLEAFADGFGISPSHILTRACAVQAAELERITRLGRVAIEPWATFLRRALDSQVRLELDWLERNLPKMLPA